MFKNLAILGGIILGVWALAKYRVTQALQVEVFKIKFAGSLQQPKIILGLDLNNPTPYSSTISKISGKIYANNSLIGIIDQNLNLDVNKESKTAIDIVIDIMPVAAITNILKYFTDKNFNLKIEGTLTIDGLPIPINYEY
jgi:LEA14-like dessication related protein